MDASRGSTVTASVEMQSNSGMAPQAEVSLDRLAPKLVYIVWRLKDCVELSAPTEMAGALLLRDSVSLKQFMLTQVV